MGSLAPVLTQGIGLAASELSRKKSRGNESLALQQLQSQQQLQERQLATNTAQDQNKIALNASIAEQDRKKALRRAVSRQRASFGAQGIGSGSGSSQAVLLGLFEESGDEKSSREGLDALRLGALDQNIDQRKSLNVLQRTQLEEKQKLNRVSGVRNFASGLFGV